MQPADGAKYATLGLTYAATIGVFTAAGWWLDQRLGTSPWLLIAGVFTGFGGGMVSLVRKVPGAGPSGRGKHRPPTDPTPPSR